MWECSKCGHKSGRRTSSSRGCDHDWWDEYELANARARQWEETEAEMQRKIFEFNDNLWNTEEGLKRLKGEKGWDWLIYEQYRTKIEINWRDSAFGTEWFLSEHGQQYLNYIQNIIIQACSNVGDFKFEDCDAIVYFGEHWLKTEQGKQYMNNLRILLKEKEVESQKYAWLWFLLFFIVIPFAYFLFMIHLIVNRDSEWWFMHNKYWFSIMFCLAAIAWLASIFKKEFWLTVLLPIYLVLSALFYGKVIQSGV